MKSAIARAAACLWPFLFLAHSPIAAEEQTWIIMGGEVYGAKPDERGPIGGGTGCTNLVAKGDCTVRDLDGLLEALSKAKAGQVVFIPGETEIDLTARIYIEDLVLKIPEGVTLAGNRGEKGSQGALLVSDALKTPVMILAQGPNVRVTGLRLKGPNPKRYLDHHRRAFGEGRGSGYYYKFPTSAGIRMEHDGLEVDNCEISGFSHAGIFLVKGKGHKIHHNAIHHCQYNGLGYGVCLDIASAEIEFNRFEWTRHAIAGTGRPGCGYAARNNIVAAASLSHCFDMHGGRDRGDGTDIAGTKIEITNNVFLVPETPVVIRGVPQEKCGVRRNWFAHSERAEQAVVASERTEIRDNAYLKKPDGPK